MGEMYVKEAHNEALKETQDITNELVASSEELNFNNVEIEIRKLVLQQKRMMLQRFQDFNTADEK